MIDEFNRHTVCVSSQSGCNLGCDFCATAKMGLMQNLSTGEIIDQLIIIRRLSNQPINNIVYMGMGEPFLNYNNVITVDMGGTSFDITLTKEGNTNLNKNIDGF